LSELDPVTLTVTDLLQAVQKNDLFSEEKKAIVIEQLFSKRKVQKELDALTTVALEAASETPLYLWEPKELTKKALGYFPNATIQLYKLPQSLFQFLEAIKPKNGQEMIMRYHQTLTTTDALMIFTMMIRHIRLMLALTDTTSESIDEITRMQPWQRSKLQKQLSFFSKKQLQNLLLELYKIDKANKTSQQVLPLAAQIDIFLDRL
ncbi:MAG TPA: hypothetical protein VJC10_01795, partial [Patescibacteria group bacterium]|nr:hypothetical protein [Patescibacteria group bacterium]